MSPTPDTLTDSQPTSSIRASVIIPAYNAEKFIPRAINSALEQTERRLEVIVVDDASTDATASIVADIANSDNRVHLLQNAVNSGPGAARNRALDRASGDWILLLDADDAFAVSNRTEKLLALGEQHEVDLVGDNLLVCAESNLLEGRPMLPIPAEGQLMSAAEFIAGDIGTRAMPRVTYGFMQPAFRRRFLEAHGLRFDGTNRFGEDFLLYVACLLKGARWWITPEPMYRYVVRSGSLTETQTAADLLRIKTREEEWLREDPVVASDPALALALRRHKAGIARRYYYRAFTDAVKSRAYGEALGHLLDTPSGFRDIMLESLVQSPRALAKALRGGYRRPEHPTQSVSRSASGTAASHG